MSAAVITWAVEALVASTLLMVVILAIRAPVRRMFGPQVAYALWAIPVLRLALPPLPAGWRQAVTTPITDVSAQVTVLIVPAVSHAAAAPSGPPLGLIVISLWVIGAALFLGWHVASYARFCHRILRRARTVDRVAGVTVVETDAAAGPLAFGIARRFIAFPRDFAARYDDSERALALAHELGHHQRGDLIANWLALGILALHWFNPIAWFAFRGFRADQEMANDARVLAGRDAGERHAYACAIVKSAHGGAIAAACHLHTINDLKGRLRMLGIDRASRTRLLIGSAAVATMTLLGLGVTASGTQAAETMRAGVEHATGVDIAALAPAPIAQDVPKPPSPPATPPTGSNARHRITIVQDGRTRTYEGAEADAYLAANPGAVPPVPPVPAAADVAPIPPAPPVAPQAIAMSVPEVTSRDCAAGEGREKQFVVNRQVGNRQWMVICSNRIARAGAEGAAMAANSRDIQRNAMQSALSGLRNARAGIAANRDMGEDQRREALAGIDEGIAEVQADMAHPDDD